MSNKKQNVDRISLLPDSLLHHILSFLHTQKVVQTCVLSRRWRTVWTCIPTLNFDFSHFQFENSSRDPDLKDKSFMLFIVKVLSQHRGVQIQKLSYSSTSSRHGENIDSAVVELLVCYAGSHDISELCIKTKNCFDWGRCLSTCRSLNVLRMSCGFVDGWGTLALPSLRILEIKSSWNDNKEFKGKMFTGCPNLESLVLTNYLSNTVSICGPKLENLELCASSKWELTFPKLKLCTPNLKCVKFDNVLPTVKSALEFSCLDKVNIEIEDCYFADEQLDKQKLANDLFKLLRAFYNAKSLALPLTAIEVLGSIPPSLSGYALFYNLRHLKLKTTKKRTREMINLPISKLPFLLKCHTLETLVLDPNSD